MLPENIKIAVIGLGYVGLPLAVRFGKQFDTLGFDINARRITELQAGHDRTLETTAAELAQATHLRYILDAAELKTCNVFIVTMPTPVDHDKRPDFTPLIKASETVGRALKPGDTVIYESTVYPGATEEICVPVLERPNPHARGLPRLGCRRPGLSAGKLNKTSTSPRWHGRQQL